jgi:N-acetylmuramoyl-L-alanine amidase
MDKVVSEILRGARTAESRRLADCIQASTVGYLKKMKYKILDGGVKGAPFFVLVGSTMPSVLVEIGYCSNKSEALRLKTPQYRQQMAQGIANGIHNYAKGLVLR